MSKHLATISKMEGELRVQIEELGRDDIEYVDFRIWMTDEKKRKEYRTKIGFSLGPRKLHELRNAIDDAIEYFDEKKRRAEERKNDGDLGI